MVSEIITVLTLLAETIMVLICLHISFNSSIRYDKFLIFFCIIICTVFFLATKNYIPSQYSILAYVFALIYCIIEFQENLWRTIWKFIMAMALGAIIELVISFLMVYMGKIEVNEISLLLSSLLTDALSFIIYVILKRKEISFHLSKHQVLVAMVCFFAYVIILSDYRVYNSIIRFIDILIFGGLLIAFFYLNKIENANIEIEKKKNEIKMQNIYGKAYEELLQQVRERQHDYKNQLAAIYGMHMKVGVNQELAIMQEEYLDVLKKKDKFDSILTGCNQPIIAGYIYNKCVLLDKDDIEVQYQLKIDQASGWDSIHEFIELLGIFFDNAHEQCICNNGKNRKIVFSLTEDNDAIVFTISNPTEYLTTEEIDRWLQKGYSTKGSNRGIGLARAKKLIEKRNGIIEIKNINLEKQNWIYFKVIFHK